MLLENKSPRMRSLKAALYSTYIDFRTAFGIFAGILAGFIISNFIITVSITNGGIVSSGTSSLNSGFMTALMTIAVTMIVITSNSELLKKFSFPIDRTTLAISHWVLIFVSPLLLLLTSTFFYLIEGLVGNLQHAASPEYVFQQVITKESFVLGFLTCYFIIVCVSAITYCVFMYFYRYKIITSVIAGLFFILVLYAESLKRFILRTADNIFFQSEPLAMFGKLLAITLAALALAYIPLKRMEVKK